MELAFVEALGVRLIRVADLGMDAQYLPATRILLIDEDLPDERRDAVMCRLLPHLFQDLEA